MEIWLNFVCDCRRGKDVYKQYDIAIGSVADDDVFKSIDMYFKGLWDEERTLNEIRYYKMNNQISSDLPNLFSQKMPIRFPLQMH